LSFDKNVGRKGRQRYTVNIRRVADILKEKSMAKNIEKGNFYIFSFRLIPTGNPFFTLSYMFGKLIIALIDTGVYVYTLVLKHYQKYLNSTYTLCIEIGMCDTNPVLVQLNNIEVKLNERIVFILPYVIADNKLGYAII
jgi:predicted aspartyl protease